MSIAATGEQVNITSDWVVVTQQLAQVFNDWYRPGSQLAFSVGFPDNQPWSDQALWGVDVLS